MNPMVLALLIMGVTILCFIFEPLPLVVVSITASLVYAFTGLIDMNAVFASYGTTTNILMIAMMVIGAPITAAICIGSASSLSAHSTRTQNRVTQEMIAFLLSRGFLSVWANSGI